MEGVRGYLFFFSFLLVNGLQVVSFFCCLRLTLSFKSFGIAVGTHGWRKGKEGSEMVQRGYILPYFSPEVLWHQVMRNPLIHILLLVKDSSRDIGHASSRFCLNVSYATRAPLLHYAAGSFNSDGLCAYPCAYAGENFVNHLRCKEGEKGRRREGAQF